MRIQMTLEDRNLVNTEDRAFFNIKDYHGINDNRGYSTYALPITSEEFVTGSYDDNTIEDVSNAIKDIVKGWLTNQRDSIRTRKVDAE